MNKSLRVVLIWALLLSPVWVGILLTLAQPHTQGNPVMLLGQAIGVTFIGIVGITVSLLTRKKKNADKISVIGYAVPAVLVFGYQLFSALA